MNHVFLPITINDNNNNSVISNDKNNQSLNLNLNLKRENSSKNNFSGINTLTLESFSLIDGHLLKAETARYIITGEKIAGESIISE